MPPIVEFAAQVLPYAGAMFFLGITLLYIGRNR
jgi:hypothetical protein